MPLRQFGLVIFFLSLFPSLVGAFNPLSVVINEIAWMGTETSYNNEWIELYNNSNSIVNLDGWKLITKDDTLEINLKGEIPEKGFFILERTDDETVLSIKADLIFKGGLNNKGEHLGLADKDRKIIDEVNCSLGWFAGDNKTKQTMERNDPLLFGNSPENWQTSQNPGGTPKVKNTLIAPQSSEKGLKEKESELEPESKEISQEEPETVVYPSGVLINEILPSPEGPDNLEEWIELKNINDKEIDISKWRIQDTIGSITTYTFPEGTKIGSMGFLVFSRPTTKITLNNSGDGLLFIQPDGNILDKVAYEKAPLGQSYNRVESGWVWSTILTPGSTNIVLTPRPSEEKELKNKASEEEPVADSETKKELAAIGEQMPDPLKPLLTFLIALGIAIVSGIIVLLLKKRLIGEEIDIGEE